MIRQTACSATPFALRPRNRGNRNSQFFSGFNIHTVIAHAIAGNQPQVFAAGDGFGAPAFIAGDHKIYIPAIMNQLLCIRCAVHI